MAVSGTGSSRANFGDLLEPGFRKVFFDEYEMIPQKFPEILKVVKIERRDMRDTSVSGFGQFVETTEGAPVTYNDPVQGKKSSKPWVNLLLSMAKTLYGYRATLSKALSRLQRLSEKDAFYA